MSGDRGKKRAAPLVDVREPDSDEDHQRNEQRNDVERPEHHARDCRRDGETVTTAESSEEETAKERLLRHGSHSHRRDGADSDLPAARLVWKDGLTRSSLLISGEQHDQRGYGGSD